MLHDTPTGLAFDQIEVGQTLDPVTYSITESTVETYWRCQGFDEAPPEWRGIVPPLLLDTLHPLKRGMAMPEGVLHAREEATWFRPARAGVELSSTVTVLQKYIKRGRSYVVFQQEMKAGEDVYLLAKKTMVWPF